MSMVTRNTHAKVSSAEKARSPRANARTRVRSQADMGSSGRLARRASRGGPIPQAKGATFYVYRLSNAAGEYYYGVRATTKAPAADRYMGTGIWPVACRKAGQKLTKRIVKAFSDYGAACWHERKLIVKAANDPLNKNRKMNPYWMESEGIEELTVRVKSEHVAKVRKYVANLAKGEK